MFSSLFKLINRSNEYFKNLIFQEVTVIRWKDYFKNNMILFVTAEPKIISFGDTLKKFNLIFLMTFFILSLLKYLIHNNTDIIIYKRRSSLTS